MFTTCFRSVLIVLPYTSDIFQDLKESRSSDSWGFGTSKVGSSKDGFEIGGEEDVEGPTSVSRDGGDKGHVYLVDVWTFFSIHYKSGAKMWERGPLILTKSALRTSATSCFSNDSRSMTYGEQRKVNWVHGTYYLACFKMQVRPVTCWISNWEENDLSHRQFIQERDLTLFSALALSNAAFSNGYQSTGFVACCLRYGDFAVARRFKWPVPLPVTIVLDCQEIE